MAKPLQLKPARDPSGKWRVNVAACLSPTEKRQQRFFDTPGEAKGFIEELKALRDNRACTPQLSIGQLLDASAAFELLSVKHPDTTLVEAAQSYIATVAQRSVSISLAELFKGFLSARVSKSAYYRHDLKWAGRRMQPFMELAACDITRTHILQAINGMPPSSRNNVLRSLRALFRYAHDLGYVKELPVRRNDFLSTKHQEISVLPVNRIRALLETALEHDPELLPILLVQTFCGVRPTEEAPKLLWSDIDPVRGQLIIRAAVSKTGTARPIILAPCALAWFRSLGENAGTGTGSIAPWSQDILRYRLRKVRCSAGWCGTDTRWTPGALRDAFCSYHLAHHGSIDRLITEAGHTDLRTTKDHYLGLVSAEAAAEFWNLFPPGHDEKVVQFMTG